jgi:hypothetical protein
MTMRSQRITWPVLRRARPMAAARMAAGKECMEDKEDREDK